MNNVLRLVGFAAATLVSTLAVSAQDPAPPSPPAVAAKLASRGDIKGIRVYEIRMVRRADVLVIEADFQNTEDTDRQVFYRFRWVDNGGMQIGDGEAWKQLLVYGQHSLTVKSVAPSSAGADFRIEFNVE